MFYITLTSKANININDAIRAFCLVSLLALQLATK